MNQAPPPKVDVSERRSSKKSIYFTKTHGLLVESLEQAIMNIRVVAQSTHPEVQDGASILRVDWGPLSRSPHSPPRSLQLYHITQLSRHMFPLSQPSQSPHIILRYNVVDWYSATVNVVHLDQGAQGLPSGPQGLMDPSQHYTPPMADILQERNLIQF